VVQRLLVSRKPITEVMGRSDVLRSLKPEALADEKFGAITVKDILAELEKPGRDPRPDFKVARFNEGVEDIKDLQPGMVLEGTVSNVAQFGAFVDLGVHQDGLVHVSQLANKFVNDAREVVKTGDIVKVKVLEVDLARKRISLTMKLDRRTPGRSRQGDNGYPARGERHSNPRGRGGAGLAMAAASPSCGAKGVAAGANVGAVSTHYCTTGLPPAQVVGLNNPWRTPWLPIAAGPGASPHCSPLALARIRALGWRARAVTPRPWRNQAHAEQHGAGSVEFAQQGNEVMVTARLAASSPTRSTASTSMKGRPAQPRCRERRWPFNPTGCRTARRAARTMPATSQSQGRCQRRRRAASASRG
jgi:predicted RNA-binding protein with RPS1 domain